MLKLLDLFSGIGGFSLGMEATKRIKTIGFVEKDKFCQKVLNKNFKNIPIEEDIRNVKGQRYTADIVSGGFPCQPFSVAGKRRGTDDDRYLWDETLRVVAETKPKWFVGENVEGIVNISNGEVLQQIQKDLEKEGFQVQCLIIPASGIGAWHQRKRVWIIGCNLSNSNNSGFKNRNKQYRGKQTQGEKGINSSSRSNIISNTNSRLSIRENEEIQTKGNTINSSSKDVSNTKKLRNGGRSSEECRNQQWEFQPKEQKRSEVWSKVERRSSQNIQYTNNKRLQKSYLSKKSNEKSRIISKGCNDNTKFKTWWQTQSELCGVPNGISYELDKGRSNRIKALGNSIVPQIAYEIGKAIVDAEDSSD
ncbi:putative DNA methylase [uncultured Mediterranean phage uvMED]|nr:putative DNA methylase [uncultured Mediterranean phage uvMED]BAR18622.1 DNA (cytosine-5-)-methyltransferase (TIGR00675) [uncultured Mediterranean phage uvMED]BAR18685.1 DNA (cytosine-5-)-methyltransferase (TIGR00675) [uncultured Mediterranean phage uvMED]BAR18738.1 DNA (cytosine-5-)-methyltransferase (TIGR00675) [uncultured Mediterranean phage uvMED]BAR18815.1 DNA (cytosine-5-)-methyltransferase (TIGR00675) [uncultured Mediterranean phage uvMED]